MRRALQVGTGVIAIAALVAVASVQRRLSRCEAGRSTYALETETRRAPAVAPSRAADPEVRPPPAPANVAASETVERKEDASEVATRLARILNLSHAQEEVLAPAVDEYLRALRAANEAGGDEAARRRGEARDNLMSRLGGALNSEQRDLLGGMFP